MAALAVALLAGCASDYGVRGRTSVSAHSHASSGQTYVVARGDTLYSIAFRNGVDYHDLAAWNGIGRDYTIYPGQRLRLSPPGQTARSPATCASPRPPPAPVPSGPAGALPTGGGSWEWPTLGPVVRGFGDDGSKGVDIAGRPGQLVLAARGGRVVYSGAALKGYGELIIVKHDERYLSAYGYNRKRLVREGDQVGAGQPIAELGFGPEQKPMLHFEIRDQGQPVNPLGLLPRR